MAERRIPVPRELIEWDGALHDPRSNERTAAQAVRETAARLNAAKRPVLLVGIEACRCRLAREVTALAERIGAPVATTVLRTDMELGSRPPQEDRDRSIRALDGRLHVGRHTDEDVEIRNVVRGLLRARLRPRRERVRHADDLPAKPQPADAPLRVADLLREVNAFLAAHRRAHTVITDSGDMRFGGLDVRVARGNYLAQGFHASRGCAVPGALAAQARSRPAAGAGRRRGRRDDGDGAGARAALGLDPIVVVVNNGGWQILRPVVERLELLALPDAATRRIFVPIEACVRPDDRSPLSRKYTESSARHGAAPGARAPRS